MSAADQFTHHKRQRKELNLNHFRLVDCSWRALLSGERYKERAQEMLSEKKRNEEKLLKSALEGRVEDVVGLLAKGVDPNCRITQNIDSYFDIDIFIYK